MNIEQYIEERLEEQINWYDTKSKSAQKLYKAYRLIEFFCAATIPFFAGIVSEKIGYSKIVLGLLGVVIAIVTAIISLNKWNENWIKYRNTCESLKKEKFLYLTKSSPYSSDIDKDNLLVVRVESLISQENTNWKYYTANSSKVKKESNGVK